MKTIETKLYTFAELSDDAQERALEKRREETWKHGTGWESELADSLKAARDHLPSEAPYGRTDPEDAIELIEALRAIPHPCPEDGSTGEDWTGYCADLDMYAAIRNAIANFSPCMDPDQCLRDLRQTLRDDADTHHENDMEYQTSDEYLRERMIEADTDEGERFTVAGSVY